jgi:hypothetical protein
VSRDKDGLHLGRMDALAAIGVLTGGVGSRLLKLFLSRYLYHLRRRNGHTQTELDIHDGEPPGLGTVVDVVVADEVVPARVSYRKVEPTKDDAEPIIHVYVDEID